MWLSLANKIWVEMIHATSKQKLREILQGPTVFSFPPAMKLVIFLVAP